MDKNSIIDYIKSNVKSVLSVIILIIIVLSLFNVLYQMNKKIDNYKHTVQMTYDQVNDTNKLAKKANLSYKEAEEVQSRINKIQSNNLPPSVSYTIQSPSIYDAADRVQSQIRNNDPSAPKELTKKVDRNLVVPNEKDQKVDVYKINLNKNHKIKAGSSYIDNKLYFNLGYQAGRFEGIVHSDSSMMPKGGTIMYTLKEW